MNSGLSQSNSRVIKLNLTPGADIDRLRQELEEYAQGKQFRQFTKTPDVNQLMDREEAIVNDGTTVRKIIRIGNEIKSVTYT